MMASNVPASLCPACRHVHAIVTGKGSRFWRCRRAEEDVRYAKYPPQPIVRCEGFELADRNAQSAD